MNGRVGNDAVAHADRVVEAGQHLAALGRLDPQAEPADFDGLFVQVHAVEVVFQNPLVQVEQGAMPAQLFQPIVRRLVGRVQLVEGFDQKGPAAASRVQQPDRLPIRLAMPPRIGPGPPARASSACPGRRRPDRPGRRGPRPWPPSGAIAGVARNGPAAPRPTPVR